MKKIFVLLRISIIICYVLYSPTSLAGDINSLIQKVIAFNTHYPQEKVYLHFDNTGYYLGETIWFKAYVVKADDLSFTNLSRVLYVELLNPEGDIVETKKLKVENGQCHGDFQLKDSLYAGFYEIRAYTRYMLNFGNREYWSCHAIDPDIFIKYKNTYRLQMDGNYKFYYDTQSFRKSSFDIKGGAANGFIGPFEKKECENNCVFSRVFPVYNHPGIEGDYGTKVMRERPRIGGVAESYKKSDRSFNVSFYPEGGKLIKGLSSKVAFKAIGKQGDNIAVKGIVRNSRGEEVVSFQSSHDGMGCFKLLSDTDRYVAEIYYRDKLEKFELPKPESSGIVMSVNALADDRMMVDIQTPDSIVHALGLSIICRGKIQFFDSLRVQAGEPCLLKIPTNNLSTGVNELTLFDANGRVWADRMVFINHEEYNKVALKVSGKKELYSPYEPVQLEFQYSDSTNSIGLTNFSLAVRDAETEVFTSPSDNIITNLLLSSDLKGYIANPGYYFEANDSHHRFDLDLLMLTQGWRRYEWKKMAGIDTFKIKQPIEKGILIDGRITESLDYTPNKRVPYAYIKITLKRPDNTILESECRADSLGRFKVLAGDFDGVSDLEITAYTKDKNENIVRKEYNIPLNRSFSPTPQAEYNFYQTNIPVSEMNQTYREDNSIRSLKLQEVTVATKRKNKIKIDFSRPNFKVDVKSESDKLIDEGFGVDGDFFFLNSCPRIGIGDAAVCYLEQHCYDKKISVLNSDSIYIYTDMATRNRYASSGDKLSETLPDVVLVYKQFSRPEKKPLFPGVRNTYLKGYSYISEFYSPDYKNNVLPEKKDFRRTLYWNPDVKADSTGRATVSFYNNSTCKKINISAETVTRDGVPVVYKTSDR